MLMLQKTSFFNAITSLKLRINLKLNIRHFWRNAHIEEKSIIKHMIYFNKMINVGKELQLQRFIIVS